MKQTVDPLELIEPAFVSRAKRIARRGYYNGQPGVNSERLIRHCTHDHAATGTRVIYSRDADPHLDGWWKNPDYARCLHLSLSYFVPRTEFRRPHQHAISTAWCRAFFGEARRWLWCEPPWSEQGKKLDVWHFRLFMAADWRTPMMPRGEIYSRVNTPRGWKSWSEVQDARRAAGEVDPHW